VSSKYQTNWRIKERLSSSSIRRLVCFYTNIWGAYQCDQHAELLQRVEQLQELVEEKDDIINRQADHIKRLTKALMGGW